MKKLMLAVAATIALAGCTVKNNIPVPETTASVAVERVAGVDISKTAAITCATAAQAINTLAPYSAKIEESERKVISTAIATIDPICSSKEVPSKDSLKAYAFESAVKMLMSASVKYAVK